MPTIYLDAALSDEQRRHRLYAGDLMTFSAGETATKLARLARELSEAAFAPHDPQVAQESMPPERYVEILAKLKPTFIHHPRAKELIAGLLSELGCDIERTYFDVPRLRTMAHGEYLKAGLAYQFHAHRDIWFSAPHQQLNWWLPVYEIESENSMAFHPQYFDTPVRNSSAGYDYEEWNKTGRQQAAKQVKKETRKQPQAEEPLELEPDVRIVAPPGGHARVLGCAAALDRPEYDQPDSLQHRLSHREPRRPHRGRGGTERRLGMHRNNASRLPARERPRAPSRRHHRQVRHAPPGGGQSCVLVEPSGGLRRWLGSGRAFA